MNTPEEVKKIKWIIKQIAEDIKENGFSTRFASLYLEDDEDAEIWENHCKFISKCNDYRSLVLFVAVIKCKSFELFLIIDEESMSLLTLQKDIDPIADEFDIKGHDSIRGFLGVIARSLDNEFTTEDEAYNTLSKDLNNRKIN